MPHLCCALDWIRSDIQCRLMALGDSLTGCSNVQLGEHTLILTGVYESPEEHVKGTCLFTCNAFAVYSELLLSIGKVGHG